MAEEQGWRSLGIVKGPKGDPGTGLTIKDFYSTLDALEEGVREPSVGDAYGVGADKEYDIYIYTSTKGWVNSGQITHDLDNYAPSYSVSESIEELKSTEKIDTAFGKIAKAIKDLIAHLANKKNPHEVTAEDTNALSIRGGTLQGSLTVSKDSLPMVQLMATKGCVQVFKNAAASCDDGLIIKDCADANDQDSSVYLRLCHADGKKSPSNAFKIAIYTDGAGNFYNIYGEHNKPTAVDVGAVPTLRRLEGEDILSIVGEGNYYSVLTKNIPTYETAGYVRIVSASDLHKVVYWRPYNSSDEYSNVMNNGNWLGWRKIPTNPVTT